jgi:hypothetical protein
MTDENSSKPAEVEAAVRWSRKIGQEVKVYSAG